MLDDPRWAGLINLACKLEGVKTFGYMHGRFNEFHVGLFITPFDYYYVWSNYFRYLYKKNTFGHCTTRFFVGNELEQVIDCKELDLKQKPKVLFVDDDQTELKQFREFIDHIILSDNFEVHVRMKNRGEFFVKGATINNVGTLDNVMRDGNFLAVIGGISTSLIEAQKFGAVGITLTSENEYGAHLIRDRLCLVAKSSKDLYQLLNGLRHIKRLK
jgi:hypothetical protein